MSQAGHGPWATLEPSTDDRRAYADASTTPFWLDSAARPEAATPLEGDAEADLVVLGAGLSGLWAALLAKERDPAREVLLIERDRVACAASGRNGGFVSSFLTHGVANGASRFAEEMPALERLGLENFAAICEAVRQHGIDCALELGGDLDVAIEPHEVGWLAEEAEALARLGHEVELLDRDQARAHVHSPLYEGGLWRKSGAATVDPARLAWGLMAAAGELGVRVHEGTPVERLERHGAGVELRHAGGRVRAAGAVLATSAFRGLVGAIRHRVLPVWDYVLVTEPLTPRQREAIGWRHRQGIGDLANRFHYYRLTEDDRVLFGGFDAIYSYGSRVDERMAQRDESFATLAAHFFAVFPQLRGVRFSHRWGGAIDTCSRFFAFQGTALGGRAAYTVGHTGLGVGASRFGAQVALDLLDGHDSEATSLRAIRSKPMPFPPEPLRWATVQLTRSRLAAADRRGGRRGIWLRTLDRFGLGFDS